MASRHRVLERFGVESGIQPESGQAAGYSPRRARRGLQATSDHTEEHDDHGAARRSGSVRRTWRPLPRSPIVGALSYSVRFLVGSCRVQQHAL